MFTTLSRSFLLSTKLHNIHSSSQDLGGGMNAPTTAWGALNGELVTAVLPVENHQSEASSHEEEEFVQLLLSCLIVGMRNWMPLDRKSGNCVG